MWPDEITTRFALWGILALAFVLRVVYVLQIRSAPTFYQPDMDPLYHAEWARAFAAGRDFQPGPFFRAPLYPWFLGVIFKLFGDGLLLPRLIQAGLGSLTALFTFLIGRELFGRLTGLLAALFAATYWTLIYIDGELLLETLAVPLNLLAVWLTMRLVRPGGMGRVALAGAAWGLAAITRPTVLLLMPLLAAWLVLLDRPAWRRGITRVAVLALGTLLPILPITAYNVVAGHDLVLISTQGGVNFWIGNNPASDGTTAIVPGTRSDWWGGYHDAVAMAETGEGRRLKPSEVSRHFAARAREFIFGQPVRAARLMGWKFRLFWTNWELGNNQQPKFFAYRFGPVTRWLPLGFGLLAPLGLLGLFFSRRAGPGNVPPALFLVVQSLAVVAFFVCARFRVPILPLLMVYAAFACLELGRLARKRRPSELAVPLVMLVVLAAWVNIVPAAVDRSDAIGLQDLAISTSRNGDDVRAVEYLRQALALRPDLLDGQTNLALALQRLGRRDEARAVLEEAALRKPPDAVALAMLAEERLGERRFGEARDLAARAVALAPAYAGAYRSLGLAARGMNLEEEAVRALERSLEIEPRSPVAAYALGGLLAREGRHADAADRYRQALEAEAQPGSAVFWMAAGGLVRELAADNREGEARRIAESLRAQFPNSPEAARLTP